jgi:hypothetical protein
MQRDSPGACKYTVDPESSFKKYVGKDPAASKIKIKGLSQKG